MSYSNPNRMSYSFGPIDFGAGGDVVSIQGPSGKAGRLIEIMVAATETFNAVTTQADVQVGTAADPDANALFQLGTLADTDSVSAYGTSSIIDADIAADTQVEVTFTAPTGGTPAGIAHVTIVIDWDW